MRVPLYLYRPSSAVLSIDPASTEEMAELDSGAIKKIYDTNDTSLSPTVQVYDVKKIGANNANSANERYRIVISDGVHYQQAMLATQMNDLVRDGKLQTHVRAIHGGHLCAL